jgi:hypothetical protein
VHVELFLHDRLLEDIMEDMELMKILEHG